MGWQETKAGRVPRVSSKLDGCDRRGAWKARWGIGRMTYLVPAGLYAVGTPSPADPVVVTANYKMSYNLVRRELAGRNVWLLVLETFGVNVWCAAGKGTFGTDELVRRVEATGLEKVVNHRRLLLPILGAPGIAAHEIRRRTGFAVQYATIRAADLPAFLDNGMVTTTSMRQLTFTFYERLVLVPVELVHAVKPVLIMAALLFIPAAFRSGYFEAAAGIEIVAAYLGAVLTGIVVTPLLLPWLPTVSLAVKGAIMGVIWTAVCYWFTGFDWSVSTVSAAFLALPAVSAFFALNFTGSTPFASRSGVKKEMRLSMPAMGFALICSLVLILSGKVF